MQKSNGRITRFILSVQLLLAGCGGGAESHSGDGPLAKDTSPPSSPASDTVAPDNPATDVPDAPAELADSENKESPPKPTRCVIDVALTTERSIAVAGYGASKQEAMQAAMQAAHAVREQMLLPELVMPMSETGDLSVSFDKTLQRILPKPTAGSAQMPDSFLARYSESDRLECKSMTLPSDRIPQWRATWTAGKKPVTIKGTSPTAIIEEARATACYGQFAGAMMPAFGLVRKQGQTGVAKVHLTTLAAKWKKNALQFAECFAQRPSLIPHDGTLSRGRPEPIHCTAKLAPAVNDWKPRKHMPDGQVSVVAPTIDRGRHLARQEIRHELFNTSLGILYSVIASATPNLRAYLVGRTFSQYWTAIEKVPSVPIACEYAGAAKSIEWTPPKGDGETRFCKTAHPWTKTGRPLQTNVTVDLESARQRICDAAVMRSLQTVKSFADDGYPQKGRNVLENLSQMFACLSSCRLDTRITFDGTRPNPLPIQDNLLNP